MVLGAIIGGLETVGECMEDETVSAFLNKCMTTEILPTIGETESNVQFASHVFDRFKNPFIKHQLRAIALNSISKFSVRVLPTILEYKEKFGTYPKGLTTSLAFLIYFYKNDTTDDSMAEDMEYIKARSINDILSNRDIWSEDLSPLSDIVTEAYRIIEEYGAKEAMKWTL
jgi:tagaturonate reductase